jgi:hypothetical protein
MMDNISPDVLIILDSLKKAVAETLDRKQRLGQYAVVWRDGKPAFIGEELPSKSPTKELENAK